MEPVTLAVIGGSGIYEIEELTDVEEVKLHTPFGEPSDAIIVGTLGGRRLAFLPRHGRGHRISPGELNSRANIYALKKLGATQIISVSACGSLREDFAPRDVVIPDQLFDRTRGRPLSFFGNGLVVHISFAEPFCSRLSALLYQAVKATGARVHNGGAFITIEGPRFSTKAESRVYRQWGMDIIGMTAIPEAQLAREAEMCYATMAHVTDYDVWHEAEEPVTVEAIIQNLMANAAIAKQAIKNLVELLPSEFDCPCQHALRDAIITRSECIPEHLKKNLDLLIGKYLKAHP
ncbi:MAG: S-methyl-5'-thioadenosine phosphorylase [Ardenticatenia bacterium]|jgi:5'-methylthioadenosine phosphorylase|nr:MAG: S-methyl-5'-thioadenosine phosphorylase [Ardenticatenia bacterium]